MEYPKSKLSDPKEDTRLRKITPYDVESGYYDRVYDKAWLGGYASGVRVLTLGADGTYQESNIGITQNPVRVFYPYDMHTMLVGIDGMGVYKVERRPQSSGNYQYEQLFNANTDSCGVLHGNGIYSLTLDIWG